MMRNAWLGHYVNRIVAGAVEKFIIGISIIDDVILNLLTEYDRVEKKAINKESEHIGRKTSPPMGPRVFCK